MSVAEALSVGTPVICAPGVGAASIVSRTDFAAVVERSPEAFARALATLLDDPQRRKHAGALGRRILASEYTWGTIARRMSEFYMAARTGTVAAPLEQAA